MQNVKLEEIADAEGNVMMTALRNAWDQIAFDCLENPLDGKRSLTLKLMAAPTGDPPQMVEIEWTLTTKVPEDKPRHTATAKVQKGGGLVLMQADMLEEAV